MKRIENHSIISAGARTVFFPLIMVLLMGSGHAQAQGGAGARAFNMDNLDQATELEVKSIGRQLDLNDARIDKLNEAVLKNRKALVDAIMKRMAEGVEDNAKLMADVYAMQVRERKNLMEAVSSFLGKAERERVGQTLGSYNFQWDSYIIELNNLGLSPEVQAKAEDRLIEFVTSYTPLRDEGYQNGDLSFVVRSMVQSKQTLDRDLEKILPAEAYAEWTKKTELKFRGPDRASER